MLREWIIGYHDAQAEDRDPKHIGLSQCGKCPRQLAFRYHGYEGERLEWRSKSIFSDGNYIQDQLRQWIHESPTRPDCYWLAGEEEEVALTTPNGRRIIGHTDGIVHHTSEWGPCPEDHTPSYLLEIKSMSSKGWRAFDYEGLEKSYVCQVSAYLKAADLSYARVLIKNKDTSDLREVIVKRDDDLVQACLRRLDSVLDSKAPQEVEYLYTPDEEGVLPWQCAYCPYWAACWARLDPKWNTKKNRVVLQGDYRGA